MPPADYIAASDGTTEAVRAIVTTERLVGATTLIVDSVTGWPNKFIATSGSLNPATGLIDDNTLTVFKGHLTGSIITIDEYAPGYTDTGHGVGQVVVLKPSTLWADLVRAYLDDLTDFAEASTHVALVKNEVVNGTKDGSNTVFTIAGEAVTGTVELYKNGVRQNPGAGNDYTVSGQTITMAVAPLAGTVLLADYATSTSQFTNPSITGLRMNETPAGTINGTNKDFTTLSSYVGGTLEVWVNGLKQLPITHFTETTPASGVFTLSDAPLTGDNILVNYHHTLSAGIGDADTVDTFHASDSPMANTILPLNASAKYPIEVISNPYKFSAYMSSTQTLTNAGTWYKLNFNTESYDTNNDFNTSTGTYTVPITGYYQFSATALMQSQAGNQFILSLGLTGTTEYVRLEQIPNTTGDITVSGTVDLYLTAGQTVFVLAYSGTAGKVIYNLFPYSKFSGRFLGA
jgi:hypothetical protein